MWFRNELSSLAEVSLYIRTQHTLRITLNSHLIIRTQLSTFQHGVYMPLKWWTIRHEALMFLVRWEGQQWFQQFICINNTTAHSENKVYSNKWSKRKTKPWSTQQNKSLSYCLTGFTGGCGLLLSSQQNCILQHQKHSADWRGVSD